MKTFFSRFFFLSVVRNGTMRKVLCSLEAKESDANVGPGVGVTFIVFGISLKNLKKLNLQTHLFMQKKVFNQKSSTSRHFV